MREALPGIPARVIADADLAQRVTELHRHLEASPDTFERESCCVATLGEFFRRHSTISMGPVPRHNQGLVSRSLELLHSCYGQRVSLAQLAGDAGLSRFHYLRVFRAETGLGPHAYLNQIRVVEAKRRLAAGRPLAEVAFACGFCDQSHLARQFKRFVGITPGQYLKACAKPQPMASSQYA